VSGDETIEQVQAAELARLRQIETAARHVLDVWPGKRSVTPFLTAMAELRAALAQPPSASGTG
jgi:hypothetical protein